MVAYNGVACLKNNELDNTTLSNDVNQDEKPYNAKFWSRTEKGTDATIIRYLD